MNKSLRIVMTILILCTFLLAGTQSARADSCGISISIRGNTDLREHTHYLRVYTSPSNYGRVQIYYDGGYQYLNVAGYSTSEQYIDYYISTWFVTTHPYSWNSTGRWVVCLSGVGGGSGGGGGGSW